MQITVTFRHLEATDAIKNHVSEKLEKLKKYLVKPVDAHVILSVEKFRHTAEITVLEQHHKCYAKEESENLYASIDMAIHKIERQLKKYKEKIKGHKPNGNHEMPLSA